MRRRGGEGGGGGIAGSFLSDGGERGGEGGKGGRGRRNEAILETGFSSCFYICMLALHTVVTRPNHQITKSSSSSGHIPDRISRPLLFATFPSLPAVFRLYRELREIGAQETARQEGAIPFRPLLAIPLSGRAENATQERGRRSVHQGPANQHTAPVSSPTLSAGRLPTGNTG